MRVDDALYDLQHESQTIKILAANRLQRRTMPASTRNPTQERESPCVFDNKFQSEIPSAKRGCAYEILE